MVGISLDFFIHVRGSKFISTSMCNFFSDHHILHAFYVFSNFSLACIKHPISHSYIYIEILVLYFYFPFVTVYNQISKVQFRYQKIFTIAHGKQRYSLDYKHVCLFLPTFYLLYKHFFYPSCNFPFIGKAPNITKVSDIVGGKIDFQVKGRVINL